MVYIAYKPLYINVLSCHVTWKIAGILPVTAGKILNWLSKLRGNDQ